MKRIRVLVVDDSATMRALIRRALENAADLEVVGDAADVESARTAIKALNPDVLTLDIELPGMNGLDFLERIMRLRPMPVVMVSTLTSRGAEATLRALELGAIDCVAKPSAASPNEFERLPEIVRSAGAARRVRWLPPAAARVESTGSTLRLSKRVQIIALAASTGGVEALMRVFRGLPAAAPPVVVVQHMPPLFTASFAQRLGRQSKLQVCEAADGMVLRPGMAVVAPGGNRHLEITGAPGGPLSCQLVEAPPINGHRPSADPLFHSVAKVAGRRSVGAILTGMGCDGADGLFAMRRAGAHTIGQDEDSCVIYGMPAVAHRIGAVAEQLTLDQIAPGIVRALTSSQVERTTDHAVRQPS